ncbi:hypothetical protein [Nonomuraea typhae]|uniref:DUF1828 domain-containing protein n=1 Tax=Nonomuraea typhae TaxID=2603600 RepID=A0ABW7YWQ7_9ACTN
MAVDLSVSLPSATTLAVVAEEAIRFMDSLLGWPGMPRMTFVTGREYQGDVRVSLGRHLSDEELRGAVIGSPGQTEFFEVDLAGYGDGAWLQVFDLSNQVDTDPVEVVVTPTRTSVGVTLSRCLAIGAAIAGGGRILEDDLHIFSTDFKDFEVFAARHRLTTASVDFADACTRFLRQFPTLNGWPQEACLPAGWTPG